MNTFHARCRQGVPCGGHAWSKDGLTWSNQTVGAFGPVVRLTNGSYFHGAYAERPQVLQAPDRTPIAFYMGFGRASYMDSANWAQLFCTAALDPSKDCGPQLPPPPPVPVPIHPQQGGKCLVSNASAFPCAGGWGDSCPILLGSCSDATYAWAWAPMGTDGSAVTLTNTAPNYAGSVANIDCNACEAGTLAKITNRADYANALHYDSARGTIEVGVCPGLCLSGTSAVPQRQPCKGGEWTSPQQIVLVQCTDPSAEGWTI